MTTDPFTEAARAEAERQWPYSANPDPTPAENEDEALNAGFRAGAEWARTYLAAQEPTDAEQEARRAVERKHQFHGSQCVCGFETDRARTRTEHIMAHYFDEVRTARAARREEG